MTPAELRERPILFSGEMIRAILDGRKTQTRRVVRDRAWAADSWPMASGGYPEYERIACPYGQPGDRLWVRETWGWRGRLFSIGAATEDVFVEYKEGGVKRTIVRPYGDEHGIPKQRCRCKPTGDEWTDREAHSDELTRFWASWRPSIHMPRWASRITLEVVSVRVERLGDISGDDVIAEGVECLPREGTISWAQNCRDRFAALWDRINAKRCPWSSNPWVFVVEFRRVS